MAKRGPKPKGRVDTSWCPELAYAVGLIVSDGSLSKNGRHIDFTSKDIDQIHTYQHCLGIQDVKVGLKNKGTCYRVQFGDVLFYAWLESIGLCPNKSLVLTDIQVPDLYFQTITPHALHRGKL